MGRTTSKMMADAPPRTAPLTVNFGEIPGELRYLNQWVLWRYVWKAEKGKGKWDKPPYQPNGKLASSKSSLTWNSFKTVKEAYERGVELPVDDPLHFDGIGFAPRRNGKAELQIVFGDLDKCRNKDTGEASADVLADMKLINSYCESSPSGTGLRFVAKGNPPFPKEKDGRKKGNFELYQGGHYLTITGQRLADFPATIEKRPDELNAFFKKHFSASDDDSELNSDHKEKTSSPKASDDQVIALASEAHNSPKFLSLMDGKYEHFLEDNGERLYPSQSEADLALCQLIAFHTRDPLQIDRVFRRSKLYREKWDREDYSLDTITLALDRTKEHYNDPTIRKISIEDKSGAIGIDDDGAVKMVVPNPKDPSDKKLKWISDCALYIDTETSAKSITEFTFKGEGAKDHRKICFILTANALEPRKFKTALINAFGAKNRVGELDFEKVQRLTRNTRFITRVEVPSWDDNVPMIPGVDLTKDTLFKLSPMIPAQVYDGDLQIAKDLLRIYLKAHPYAGIVLATIFCAPAMARWKPDDRIALALWAVTGTLKTTFLQLSMCVYGIGYLSDAILLKHGSKTGSTAVAALEVMALAGMLPQLLDDVKSVDPKDLQNYISIIHASIEGSDKKRGKKDGGLRESQVFRCTPIITGEIRPEEASTDARVLNLTWSKPNLEFFNQVQRRADEMPIIGYHWLRFLAETNLNLNDGFNEARSLKEFEFSKAGYTTNSGRLATIYTALMGTWNLMCESPFGDVFKDAKEDFVHNLKLAIQEQAAIVNSDTEISKFLCGVNELLASQPSLFQSVDGKTLLGRVVGKRTDEGLFLMPNAILAELDKLKVFTQKPTVDSMGKALDDAGKLVRDKDKKHRQVVRRVSGERIRGWLVTPSAFVDATSDTTEKEQVVSEKQQHESSVTTDTTDTTEKEKNIFLENFEDKEDVSDKGKGNNDNGGDSGDNGDSNGIDSVFCDTTPSPLDKHEVTPSECKCAEDVVAYLDQRGTAIRTPVLQEFLSPLGISYVAVTCQLEERGWKLDPETRTMCKEQTEVVRIGEISCQEI